jgi:hypothetical protein
VNTGQGCWNFDITGEQMCNNKKISPTISRRTFVKNTGIAANSPTAVQAVKRAVQMGQGDPEF